MLNLFFHFTIDNAYLRLRIACLVLCLATIAQPSNSQVSPGTKPFLQWQSLMFRIYSGDSIPYEFGMLKVPENRLNAASKNIELGVLRLKRKSPVSTSGSKGENGISSPIVFLAGGPGQSGIDYIKEEYFQKFILKLQETADIILLDQRGVGRSKPSLGYPISSSDNRNLFLSKDRMIKLTDEAAAAGYISYKKSGIDIKGYNTSQSADDLKDLAEAIGAEKISLLGISYGTHLSLATARKYPGMIDKMVLIGTSGLNHMHHLPSTYDKQLQKIAALSDRDSLINSEVPDLIALLKRVLKKLDDQPIPLRIKDYWAKKIITVPIGKFGLQFILRLDAGDSYGFVYFPALLYGIEHGDYRLLQQYTERRYNQFNGLTGSGIFAMRQASGASKERYQQIKEEGKTAILGNSMNTPDIYAGWRDVDLGDEYRKSFKSEILTLFISGSLDSNTPVANVEEIIQGFSKGVDLVVENAGHEDMLPDEKVQDAMLRFFKSGLVNSNTIIFPVPEFIPVF
ncbi:alpha/beta hydrolase [Flavitalea sp.]|nr:alpha/beta fold hydrolase [Flavitalea sp.]